VNASAAFEPINDHIDLEGGLREPDSRKQGKATGLFVALRS
jgi:hypothetical protein